MTKIRLVGTKDRSWNADKTIHVFVDGVKQTWFLWGNSLERAYKIVKNHLGIKRAKKEFVYEADNERNRAEIAG